MPEEFFRFSTVTGKSYNFFQCVKILNNKQAAFYMANGVELRDIRISKDKNDKACLVFYFYKNETKQAYDAWCKQKETICQN